ncbi:hypothetical protein Tco_1055822 [Tanacetum coccineum]|uniref:Uncharacterized protein n=1 Tax=Tanacetum coccineum TaxID=301880 RepID=A0ABQ5H259_9ASTR
MFTLFSNKIKLLQFLWQASLQIKDWIEKTLGGRGGESFWERGDDFGMDGLRFHTWLTDILCFLEKLEWWFEQDIDEEEVRFEGDEDGDKV